MYMLVRWSCVRQSLRLQQVLNPTTDVIPFLGCFIVSYNNMMF